MINVHIKIKFIFYKNKHNILTFLLFIAIMIVQYLSKQILPGGESNEFMQY